ncbi:MAG: hypothetical protein ACI8QZ_002516 [Chlamydiales bacterium]|jgi:hypothetical protein
MSELTFATEVGELRVRGWCADTMRAAAQLGRDLARAGRARDDWIDFEGRSVRLKARPSSRRSPSIRPLVRRPTPVGAPAIQEYIHLSWLIERHFQTVLPLAAGVFLRRHAPQFQYLLTRRERDTLPLNEALRSADQPERDLLRDELARELGRMHALGFRHGNLSACSLLVLPFAAQNRRRLVFLKPCGQRARGPLEADVAQILAAGHFDEDQGEGLMAAYAVQRRAQGRPIDGHTLRSRVTRARARIERLSKNTPTSAWDD